MSVEARIQTLTFSMWGKHSTEPLQQHQCLYITSLVSWQLSPMLYGHMDASWPTDIKLFTYMYDLWPKIKILKVSLVLVHANEITRMCSKDGNKADRNRKTDRLTDRCVLLRFRSNSTSLAKKQKFVFQK